MKAMSSWRALIVRFAQEFGWDLDRILKLTRPQARLLLQGLSETVQVKNFMQSQGQGQDRPPLTRGGGHKRPSLRGGDGTGAYTDRYVKGKGNVLVCPPQATTETDQVKDKAGRVISSRIKLQDPRALFGLPGAKPGTAPGFKIIDRRKNKGKKKG